MTPEEYTETEKLLKELYKKEFRKFFIPYIGYFIAFIIAFSSLFYSIFVERYLNQTFSISIVIVIVIILLYVLKKLWRYKDKLECVDIKFTGKLEGLKEFGCKLSYENFVEIYFSDLTKKPT